MNILPTKEVPDEVQAHLKDFDFAVKEVEENYSGFFDKVSFSTQDEYTEMKKRIRENTESGRIKAIEAVAMYCAWFQDFHMWTDYEEEWKFYPDTTNLYSSIVYHPCPLAEKVNDDVFMIRFPSCDGTPTIKWIKRSIRKYRWSKCNFLIIDIRGNNGGSDFFTKPYLNLLYDHSAELDGITVRNTEENITWLKRNLANSKQWQAAIKQAENSSDEFTVLTPSITLKQRKSQKKPYSAAIIIDHNVSSSAEQFLLSLQVSSNRVKIYGKDNTLGCLDYSNSRTVILPNCHLTFQIPTTRSMRVDRGKGINGKGIEPQIIIPLDYPQRIENNIDPWIFWVANDLKERESMDY